MIRQPARRLPDKQVLDNTVEIVEDVLIVYEHTDQILVCIEGMQLCSLLSGPPLSIA